jgi:two-component system OmpR family sensor kinase
MKASLIIASLIYFVAVGILFASVYHFLQWRHPSSLSFFVAGGLVLLVALGWWVVISSLIMAPKKEMEVHLEHLVNDIIHELNIPLSTIRANSDMLKRSLKEDSRSLQRLSRIEDASARLERLYAELVYRIKKETQQIEKERFLLAEMVRERVRCFEEQGRNPFALDIPEEVMIMADRIGFEQMLDNLIANAMKYSDKEALITIAFQDKTLSIKDRGIGMESTELMRVMERYFQSDPGREGKGIGLALVKAYCDSEGIDIHIRSQKGEGTDVRLDVTKVLVTREASSVKN